MGEPYELFYIPIMGTSFKFLNGSPGLEATAQALESSTEGLQSDHKAWQGYGRSYMRVSIVEMP